MHEHGPGIAKTTTDVAPKNLSPREIVRATSRETSPDKAPATPRSESHSENWWVPEQMWHLVSSGSQK